ncbi:UNVERIFIED_ORG: hypothetical protein ABIC62_002781 [Burkholderia sp. 1595]|uniref:Uncharacterized protein n=1 Tax=Paraburkholderia terricola TaxID=169427 RepID=A0ABU1LTU7_9BURK|nr:hypothetical protein [Paraburkholderia terricola]MDR6481288.1 hypothetical protein [Paraburkholderia terricola]
MPAQNAQSIVSERIWIRPIEYDQIDGHFCE